MARGQSPEKTYLPSSPDRNNREGNSNSKKLDITGISSNGN